MNRLRAPLLSPVAPLHTLSRNILAYAPSVSSMRCRYFNVPTFGDWLAARSEFRDAFKWHRQVRDIMYRYISCESFSPF